jgi:hypothetical protein
MQPCSTPLTPAADLPRAVGETVRYVVDVNGLSVGTIDFRIEKRGTFGGQPVTEYRSLFKIDQLVGTVLPVEGRAAALVGDASYWPTQAMSKYTMDKNDFEESQTYAAGGRGVSSRRVKNGKPNEESRVFPGPAQDFVSAFYLVRSLPPDVSGCAIIYASQRAYTVWIKPDGDEKVMTPVGLKQARRYAIVWASDKAKKPADAKLWVGDGPDRLPLKAELFGPGHLEARIHLYETGKS